MDKTETFLICFTQIILVLTICLVAYHLNNLDRDVRRMKLWDDKTIENDLINGLSIKEEYYCVWTEGRKFQDINRTDYHEACHQFINRDTNNHFCKEAKSGKD